MHRCRRHAAVRNNVVRSIRLRDVFLPITPKTESPFRISFFVADTFCLIQKLKNSDTVVDNCGGRVMVGALRRSGQWGIFFLVLFFFEWRLSDSAPRRCYQV